MKLLILSLSILALFNSLPAGDQLVDSTNVSKYAPKIYLDCKSCDLNYIRTEIPFINYVRDRHEAQVHMLITRESTGSGGRDTQFCF